MAEHSCIARWGDRLGAEALDSEAVQTRLGDIAKASCDVLEEITPRLNQANHAGETEPGTMVAQLQVLLERRSALLSRLAEDMASCREAAVRAAAIQRATARLEGQLAEVRAMLGEAISWNCGDMPV